MNKAYPIFFSLCFLTGCTSVNVKKVDATKHPIKLVCIEENPAVLVDDLIFVLESGFQRRGINTIMYQSKAPDRCEYTLWYTAFRAWDLVPYLRRVELRLRYGDDIIATATYNHGGGFDLSKFAGTEEKLNPVMDELLSDFSTNTRESTEIKSISSK